MPTINTPPANWPMSLSLTELNHLNRLSQIKSANRQTGFKVVLLYEDLPAGLRGAALLQRLPAELQVDSDEVDTEIGKFEQLLFVPELMDQMTFRLMWADLIIVATAGDAELPAHMRMCLERALALRRKGDATLLAMPDWKWSAAGETPRLCTYLRQLAQKCGLQFSQDPPETEWPAQWETAGTPAVLEMEGDVHAFHELVPRDSGGRDWGIND